MTNANDSSAAKDAKVDDGKIKNGPMPSDGISFENKIWAFTTSDKNYVDQLAVCPSGKSRFLETQKI